MLLAQGQVAYFGKAKNAANFTASEGLPCPEDHHIADHLLDFAIQTKKTVPVIVENNEADRGNQLLVSLSSDEQAWLTGSFSQDILGVSTKDQLDDIMFRAEIMGIEAYPVFITNGSDNQQVSCVALGPDDSGTINKLIHSLKPI